MSGVEFIAVAGVISSIIAIADGIKQVVNAVSEVEGLPKSFRQASNKLPLISDILEATKHSFEANNVSRVEKSVTLVVNDCQNKWKTLKNLFDKIIPEEKASRVERYYKAVKILGKGSEVESLMKGMLVDVQLLATIKTVTTASVEKVIKTMTAVQEDKIPKAITDVAAWPPSVPDDIFQDGTHRITNYGTSQYVSQGGAEQNIFQGGSRQYQSGGGAQTINEAQTIINGILNIHLQGAKKKDEARACLTALFLTYPRDDREKLIQMKGPRVEGTCEWIKTNKLYNSWIHSHSQLLWLSGGPGKGKTMLSIFLAQELERTVKDSQDVSFLQYFCDNKDEKRNSAVAIIRGMIFQLLQLRPKLIDHILPSFEIQNESLFTASSFETLWRIFETMLGDPVLGTVYCIIDGLDECDEASLVVLLKKFRALFSTEISESSACHLNLIIVSRGHPDFIPEMLSNFSRIRLDPDVDKEVNNDIHRFIEVKINELSIHRQYPKPLRVRLEKVFRDRAQGTFLWIGIVAQELRKYKATEVEKALDLFPPGLEALYARMLLQIDLDRRETTARILLWVVMAIRPLTLSELSVAIDVKPSVGFSRNEVMRDHVSYCGYFLTIKKGEVGLIHQSAKDYLLRKTRDSNPELEVFRVKEEVGNLEIARKCLEYLQNGALENGKVDLRMDTAHSKDFPLLSYAALHWHEHARSLARSEDIFDLSLPFYHEESLIRASWLRAYWDAERPGLPPDSFTLLHLASCFGILPLVENLLLEKGLINWLKRLLYLNKKDDNGRTALIWAARGGYSAIVQLLLEKGAGVNTKDRHGNTALIEAAEHGHEAVVRLLLEKGAGINVEDRYGNTALIWAARYGHEAVVRLLLEKGVGINVKDRNGNTALIWAAWYGHEAVVRLLLEKGAVINMEDRNGNTALISAAKNGYEAVVRLLLEKGAGINVEDHDGNTALISAAKNGYEAVVRLLLEKGAGTNVEDCNGNTPLIWAARYGHEAVVRLLLEKGADVDTKNSDGNTALIRATEGGYEAVVRLLLEMGVGINVEDRNGNTALTWAAKNGYESVVRLLLEKGVGINMEDRNGNIALIWAARFGHEAIVRLLLEKGAGINVEDRNGDTALIWVAWFGHEAMVRLLLEKGAGINVEDRNGHTALIWAARFGHEVVVRLLLEKGAGINVEDCNGNTALFSAAKNGYEAVVQLLLEKGVGINVEDRNGKTVLIWAARYGYEAVVRLLLEKGAGINVEDRNGNTALIWAARYGHEAVVRLLLEKGAGINVEDRNGNTALIWAARYGYEAIMRLLLEKGADVNTKDSGGDMAPIGATEGGYEVVVRLLLEKETGINVEDRNRNTALIRAARYG